MAANRALAQIMGLSEVEIAEIDSIHSHLEHIILTTLYEEDVTEVIDIIKEYEFLLQDLWGFERIESKHTWGKEYLFKRQWVGRTFQCEDTGTIFTIPNTVRMKDFFIIGEGSLDVGDGKYFRLSGNITEKQLTKNN